MKVEVESLLYMMTKMEEKLRELMGDEEYQVFARQTAKDALLKEIDEMLGGDIREFVLEHFDEITSQGMGAKGTKSAI